MTLSVRSSEENPCRDASSFGAMGLTSNGADQVVHSSLVGHNDLASRSFFISAHCNNATLSAFCTVELFQPVLLNLPIESVHVHGTGRRLSTSLHILVSHIDVLG